jgi:hypothetical protein
MWVRDHKGNLTQLLTSYFCLVLRILFCFVCFLQKETFNSNGNHTPVVVLASVNTNMKKKIDFVNHHPLPINHQRKLEEAVIAVWYWVVVLLISF